MPKYFLALYAPEPTSPPPAATIKQISDMFEAYTQSLKKIGAYVEGDGFQGTSTAQTNSNATACRRMSDLLGCHLALSPE